MSTSKDPREIALELARSSPLRRVQMGAVIIKHGEILGVGRGCSIGEYAMHAELAAIRNALDDRCFAEKDLWGSRIVVGGIWRKSGNFVSSARPCTDLKKRFQNISRFPCMTLLRKLGIKEVEYVIKNGTWIPEPIR